LVANARKVCLYPYLLVFQLSLGFISPALAAGDSVSQYGNSWTPEWYDCGGSSWYQGYDKDHEYALRSGPIECTGFSRICANVTGPAKISFLWKSDVTNQMVGQLSFQVDDTRHMCDSSGWTPISYSIWDNETHKLMWEFRKIKCYPKNVGAGWIGDVFIEYGDDRVKPVSRIDDSGTGDIKISDGIKPPLTDETTILSSNITIATTSIRIISSDVMISSTNITIAPDEVKIFPKNVTMVPAEITISSENVPMMSSSIIKVIPLSRDDRPTVELIHPKERFLCSNTSIQFSFRAFDDIKLSGCKLYINDYYSNVEPTYIGNNEYMVEYSFGEKDRGVSHNWYVECCDSSNQCNISETRHLTVLSRSVNVTDIQDLRTHNYTTINDALKNVAEYGTVFVERNISDEKIFIDKPVKLVGLNYPLIRDNNNRTGDGVLIISSSDVLIDGFKIQGSVMQQDSITRKESAICTSEDGIFTDISISNTTMYGGKRGIRLFNCTNVEIGFNNITEFETGMALINCSRISIYRNVMLYPSGDDTNGIYLENFNPSDINASRILLNNISARKCVNLKPVTFPQDEIYDTEQKLNMANNFSCNVGVYQKN
jgi:hypothetical protein